MLIWEVCFETGGRLSVVEAKMREQRSGASHSWDVGVRSTIAARLSKDTSGGYLGFAGGGGYVDDLKVECWNGSAWQTHNKAGRG